VVSHCKTLNGLPQVKFIELAVLPQYQDLAAVFPGLKPLLDGVGSLVGSSSGKRMGEYRHLWAVLVCSSSSSSSSRKVSGFTPTAVFALATPKSPIDRIVPGAGRHTWMLESFHCL
jgi:hypothetical protein